MDRSERRAWEILKLYVKEVEQQDLHRQTGIIKSIILVGSLSDNTYTGNAGSDIDLVHIVSDEADYALEKRRINDMIDRVWEETGKEIPIARVVYQQKHLRQPYEYDFELSKQNKDLMQRPIEILRVLDSGIVVYGENLISSIERPKRGDVEMSHKLNDQWLEVLRQTDPDWYEGYIRTRDRPSLRIMTQIVLTTALSEYYFYTGRSCSSKFHILERVEQELPELPYLNLLRLCHKNRFRPEEITQEDTAVMNREYQTCFKTREKAWPESETEK